MNARMHEGKEKKVKTQNILKASEEDEEVHLLRLPKLANKRCLV